MFCMIIFYWKMKKKHIHFYHQRSSDYSKKSLSTLSVWWQILVFFIGNSLSWFRRTSFSMQTKRGRIKMGLPKYFHLFSKYRWDTCLKKIGLIHSVHTGCFWDVEAVCGSLKNHQKWPKIEKNEVKPGYVGICLRQN